MKINKQRLKDIKHKRLVRAEKAAALICIDGTLLPPGTVAADHAQLQHVNSYTPLPDYYIDKEFTCRDCGSHEVWTAKQQKWWYEIIKGNIDSTAVRCRPCRKMEKQRKAEARRLHFQGLARKSNNGNGDEK